MIACELHSMQQTLSEIKVQNRQRSINAAAIESKRLRLIRVEKYNLHPDRCPQCDKPLSYEDSIAQKTFCNRSCSASFNNLGVRHNGKPKIIHQCLSCGKDTFRLKFCSCQCSASYRQAKIWEAIEKGEYTLGHRETVKKYLLEKRGYQCEQCGLKEWQAKPIPLESHHVDGDFRNNLPSNLKLLCLNCHGSTPNYGARNKGKGRFVRRQRYKDGKSQ